MSPLKVLDKPSFGGVDSRSNPVNMSGNRFLRLRNYIPRPDGHLELRDGYTKINASGTSALDGPIHSPYPYHTGINADDFTFSDTFATGVLDTTAWVMDGGSAPGNTPTNVGTLDPTFYDMSNGCLALKMTQAIASGIATSIGAELRSLRTFGYGTFTFVARMSSTATTPTGAGAAQSGSVSGPFMFMQDNGILAPQYSEIDFEVEGQNPTQLELTSYTTPTLKTTFSSFQAAMDAGWHTYQMVWAPGRIDFFVDGILVRTTITNVPTAPAYIMVNHWGTNDAAFGGVATAGTRWMYVQSISYSAPSTNSNNSIVFWQGTIPKKLDLNTLVVTGLPVLGAPVQSSALWSYALGKSGFLYGHNGTDKKFYDGVVWRDIGLRALTLDELANVVVSEGITEITQAHATAVALAFAAGGAWTADAHGRLFYLAYFDTSTGETSPATIPLGTGLPLQGKGAAGQKLNFTGIDVPADAAVVKLLLGTQDGQASAGWVGASANSVQAMTLSGTTVNVTRTAHGLTTGDVVVFIPMDMGHLASHPITGPYSNIPFQVTVIDADHFSVQSDAGVSVNGNIAGPAQLFIWKLQVVANAATTATISNPATILNMATWALPGVNTLISSGSGIAASSVGGAQPGYQFYASLYNRVGGGHVGNRMPIGGRIANAQRANFKITGLPGLVPPGTASIVASPGGLLPVPAVAITSLSEVGNLVTLTVPAASFGSQTIAAVQSGDWFQISLAGQAAYNGVWRVASILIGTGIGAAVTITFVHPSTGLASTAVGSVTLGMMRVKPVAALMSFTPGDPLTVSGAGLAGFNGDWEVRAVLPGFPDSWIVYFPVFGLADSGGGVISDAASGNGEWEILIGRTGDGGEVPYAIVDDAGNWISVPNGRTFIEITQGKIDGNAELPINNGVPPAFNTFWREGNRLCGSPLASASVYRSGSEQDAQTGVFMGDPAQAWAPKDVETFPTAEAVVAGFGNNQESWVFTANDLGILSELSGEVVWSGPWNSGIASRFAFRQGWSNSPFWITSDKQLATMADASGPVPISGEYEAALLAKVGDPYMATLEVDYLRDSTRQIDALRIKARDSTGNPFTVIHDFNLRDSDSPYGQAYENIYLSELATDYTQVFVRDANGKGRVWAGAADGSFYQFYRGGNDNGLEFVADGIALIYVGPNNTAIKIIDWYGDSTAKWYISDKLDQAADPLTMIDLTDSQRPVPGEEHNSRYQVDVPSPEMTHVYLWVRLASHSADGSMALNDPPHMPLESYGRIYMVSPIIGTSRGR
jgi:endo-1,3-1,4-beta-glycanase ExoK